MVAGRCDDSRGKEHSVPQRSPRELDGRVVSKDLASHYERTRPRRIRDGLARHADALLLHLLIPVSHEHDCPAAATLRWTTPVFACPCRDDCAEDVTATGNVC